jgi:hypothetical protein
MSPIDHSRLPSQSQGNLILYAGGIYLVAFAMPIVTWLVFFADTVDGADLGKTMEAVQSGVAGLRVAVLFEILGAAVNLCLGLLLYQLLVVTGRRLAVAALAFKLLEVALWTVIALGHLAALSMLESSGQAGADALLLAVSAFFAAHMQLTAVSGFFSGAGMLLFALLLSRVDFVPGRLVRFGVLSYVLVIGYDSLCIALPEYAQQGVIQVLGSGPVCLFSLFIGVWLLATKVRGVPAAKEVLR